MKADPRPRQGPTEKGRSVPAISYQCSKGRHTLCAKLNCNCDCHKSNEEV